MRTIAILSVTLVALAAAASVDKPASFHDLTVNTLDGKPKSMADYKGKVLLVVNTASECGYTPQYAGLETFYERYRDRGVVVLGFPSNDFGGQEPGTPEQIRTFCETKYHVQFPLFEKVHTKGEDQAPVYRFLTTGHGEPKWNFHKYVVGKDGQVRAEFASKVTPESDELRAAVEAALAE